MSKVFIISAEQKMELLPLTCAFPFFFLVKRKQVTVEKKRGEESKSKGIGRKVTAISRIFYARNLETEREE